MNVDLVNVVTRDGIRLDGVWRKPPQPNVSRLGVDVVILHHGAGGSFYEPGSFETHSESLLRAECAVMRVNNRSHDYINRATVGGKAKRFGTTYEVIDECRYDWEAWVDFAEAAGYRRIALWGYRNGALKSIYYMAVQNDSRVKCLVSESAPRFSYFAFAAMEKGAEFKRVSAEAQQHIARGHPETLQDITIPTNMLVTAATYIEKYGPEEKYDILKHIPNVRVPLLATIKAQELETLMPFQGLRPEMERFAMEMENLTFELIPSLGTIAPDQADYGWNLVSRWLENV